MKNLLRILFFGLLTTTVFISCDKNKEEESKGDVFSPLSVEENKANLEETGISLLNEAKDLENTTASNASNSFVHFADNSDPFAGNPDIEDSIANIVLRVMQTVHSVGNISNGGVEGVYRTLKSTKDDPETAQEAYDMLTGIYAWNHTTYAWDFTKTGNEIRFEYPSTDTGTENNSVFRIYGYTGYTGSNPYSEDLEYTGDLPQTIYAELNVDNVNVMSYSMEATYNANGEATALETSLTIDGFVLTASLTNTANTAASVSYSLTHNDNTLIAMSLAGSGDWSQSNIDNNTTTEYDYYTWEEWVWNEETQSYDIVEVTDTNEYTNVKVQKIFKEGNATFQLMNIKIVGIVDVEKLGDAMDNIDNTYDWNTQQEEATNAQVAVVNENVNLSVRYADSDEIIAYCEAYPVSEDYTWTDWVYNEETGNWDQVEVTETDYWIDLRFVFADGSKIDAETYFESGFSELEQQLEDWLDSLESNWNL